MNYKKITSVIILVIVTLCIPMGVFAKPIDGGTDTYCGELPELQNAIAKQAVNCAYAPGTSRSVYRYHGGSPKAAYREALSQAYGSRSGWSKQTRAGASCDVFVGTVIRSCGYDTEFPRALAKDLGYLPASSKFKRIYPSISELQPGDIIMYLRHGGGGHICVYVEVNGQGYIANAHYSGGGAYGCIDMKPGNIIGKSYKRLEIYRATGDCTAPYSEGDASVEVKKVQDFLKWAGYLKGQSDGKYGNKTIDAVKKFQKDAGLEVTGNFGKESLEAAGTFSKDSAGTQKE